MKFLRTPQNKQLMKMLNAARRRTGLTQQALAEKIGEPRNFVSEYESGQRRLDAADAPDRSIDLGKEPSRRQ